MAGDIFAKERSIVTLTSSGASLTNASAGIANATANLDCRTSGNAADDFECTFELIAQWGTVTGMGGNSLIAELYLLPVLDGTNTPDVDLSSGGSVLPLTSLRGSFIAAKQPTVSTDARFPSSTIVLSPLLYKPYILNRSGQTISANWTLKVVSARAQYS